MMKKVFNKNYIDFGDFKIDTVDFWLLIAYIESRKATGIKNNTILREISTISSAFEKVYKLRAFLSLDHHAKTHSEKPCPLVCFG